MYSLKYLNFPFCSPLMCQHNIIKQTIKKQQQNKIWWWTKNKWNKYFFLILYITMKCRYSLTLIIDCYMIDWYTISVIMNLPTVFQSFIKFHYSIRLIYFYKCCICVLFRYLIHFFYNNYYKYLKSLSYHLSLWCSGDW